jgi:type IV secretory pathway TraG/TraD family ATPase VirD4
MGAGTGDMNIAIGTTQGGRKFAVDSDYHVSIQGASGVGKSTLLKNMFVEFLRAGGGACLIDMHGDLADQTLSLIPSGRRRDVIWFDPSAHRVPPLNPLHFRDPDELQLAQESLAMILKAFAGDAWGNETPWVIRNSIIAVCQHSKDPTPVHVFRFLVDDEFRNEVLEATDNPFLKLFQKQYEQLRATEQMAKFSPAINKEGKLMHPALVPVIGQKDSLDFLDIMNRRKIVICRFSKGRLGEDAAEIYASLVSSMISIAALKRESQPVRPPFLFMVDEAGSAAHGGRFASLLEESRKYGISLVLGFQGMYQLPFADAVSTNCSTKIIYNSSGIEAEATTKDWIWSDQFEYLAPENITALPRYTFYCRTFKDNQPVVKKVAAFQSVKRRYRFIDHAKRYQRCLECHPESLKEESLLRYSKDKQHVMRGILKLLD